VAATRVERGNAMSAWRVHLDTREALPADGVVLAGSAFRTAELVAGLDPVLADRLRAVSYASSAAVTLAYPLAAFRHPLDAFGYLVPRVEGRATIACSFSSIKYPGRAPPGFALLRVFLGGDLDAAVLEEDDAELARLAEADVAALLGATGPPVLIRVMRHHQA